MEQIQALLMGSWQDPESRSIVIGIALTVVAAGVFVLIIKLTNRLLLKANAQLEAWRGTRIPSLRIQTLEVVSADRLTAMLQGLLKVIRLAALLVILFIFLPLILRFLPWTKDLTPLFLQYAIAPVKVLFRGFVSWIPNLFFIAIILFITRYVLKFTRVFFSEIHSGNLVFPGFHLEWAHPTSKLVRLLIIVFAVILISPYLPGFGSPAFQGISIFLGVLFSLGSTAAIANIIAGVALTYMRAFAVGDRVRIADTMGDVVEKSLMITRVRTVKNVEVTIPNAMVLGSHMINFSALAEGPGLILYTSVTIGYDVPWKKVHTLLIDAARTTADVLEQPEPFVLQTSLNDFSVTYELNAYINHVKRLASIQSDLHGNIQDKFNEAGIEIMSPSFSALRDGNEMAIPEEYLPKREGRRGFRILPLEDIYKPRQDPASGLKAPGENS